MHRLLKRFARCTEGIATVEVVIWLPIVLLAFSLSVDASWVFHSQSEGLRIVRDANCDASNGRLTASAEAEPNIGARLRTASTAATATATVTAGANPVTGSDPARDFRILGFSNEFNDLPITVRSEQMIEDRDA